MANLKIRSASDLVKLFDKEPSFNPPAPRRYYDEADDIAYLAVASPRALMLLGKEAIEQDLDPVTFEPRAVDDMLADVGTSYGHDRYGNTLKGWDRTYGRHATDFGNYIDFLRSN